jgi:hypothetical protein
MRVVGISPWRKGQGQLASSIGALALFACLPCGDAVAATCSPTGFMRDSINLTAALINPGDISGDVDATGCHIGVYYSQNGHVENANIHGAKYFGIVNNGAEVDVRHSTISDIGEKPFNGTQHGVAVIGSLAAPQKARSRTTTSRTIKKAASSLMDRTPPPIFGAIPSSVSAR